MKGEVALLPERLVVVLWWGGMLTGTTPFLALRFHTTVDD